MNSSFIGWILLSQEVIAFVVLGYLFLNTTAKSSFGIAIKAGCAWAAIISFMCIWTILEMGVSL